MPDRAAALKRYSDVPVLVLGGSGFIGLWVGQALCDGGARLTATTRGAAGEREIHLRMGREARVIRTDLTEAGAVLRVIEATRPAVVFNLAGYGVDRSERNAGAMEALNADLPLDVCQTLADVPVSGWEGVRFVHVGSALEYGHIGDCLAESREPRPTTEYGRTKLLGTERVARFSASTGFRAVTVRLFNVFGPGEHAGRLLPSLLRAASGVPTCFTSGAQERDFTYVEDAAEGLLRIGLSAAAPGEIVNLATGRLVAVRDFVDAAVQELQIDPALLHLGTIEVQDGEVSPAAVDISRLIALTAWQPVTTVAEGIRRSAGAAHAH